MENAPVYQNILKPTFAELKAKEKHLCGAVDEMRQNCEMLLSIVTMHIRDLRHAAGSTDAATLDLAQPERWLAITATHFQEGLMTLKRSLTQPTSF